LLRGSFLPSWLAEIPAGAGASGRSLRVGQPESGSSVYEIVPVIASGRKRTNVNQPSLIRVSVFQIVFLVACADGGSKKDAAGGARDAANLLDGQGADASNANKDSSSGADASPDGSAPSGEVGGDATPVDAAKTPDVAAKTPDVAQDDASDAASTPDVAPDTAPDVVANCGRIKCDCTFKGRKLWGKIQYVQPPVVPDVKVKVTTFPDLRVDEVTIATKCGQWQIVTSLPDLKVQKVDFIEDFQIQYSPFPGIP
jgi:hypothetical protein